MNEHFGIWREMAITAAPIEPTLPGANCIATDHCESDLENSEAGSRKLFVSQPSVSTAGLDEAYIDEDNEQKYLDDDAS